MCDVRRVTCDELRRIVMCACGAYSERASILQETGS